MREKNDLKSFAGKRLRSNRSNHSLAPATDSPVFSAGTFDDLIQARRDTGLPQRESLQAQQNALRDEIKRGREHLQRVQKELDDTRACLEQWNRYELISSVHPLNDLIRTMTFQEKTQQFLVDWLSRKQEKLTRVRGESAARKNYRGLK